MFKIYLSGPITGIPDYKARFEAAEKRMRDGVTVVINPARQPEGMNRTEYMRRALSDVCDCDMVYLLRGWEHSHGARIERDLALYLDKVVAYEEVAEQDEDAAE